MDNAYLLNSDCHPNGRMDVEDQVLDGFTVQQLVGALRQEKKKDNKAIDRIVSDMLLVRVQDMLAIVDANRKEIIQLAS